MIYFKNLKNLIVNFIKKLIENLNFKTIKEIFNPTELLNFDLSKVSKLINLKK